MAEQSNGFRTRADEIRERENAERVVGVCGLCGGRVIDGKEFVEPHCRKCGAVPKRSLPVVEMEPKR